MSVAVQRQAVADLTSLARRDLTGLFAALRGASPTQVRDALMDVLPLLGSQYGDAAALLAAEWFTEARLAAEVAGTFSPVLAQQPTPARWQALARWGVDPLFGAPANYDAALALVVGGLQRSIADQHRLTIVESSLADPAASGWRRVGVGDSCGFCRMLIDRGHVYTDKSVTFRSHDNCSCAASPSWAPNVTKVSREPYRQSRRNRSDATKARDNARAREYIASNYGDN